MNVSQITHSLESSTGLVLDELRRSNKANVSLHILRSTQLMNDIAAIVWYVAPPVLLVFGTFGNVMTVVVMRGMRRASQSSACLSVYFTALALSDQVHLTASVPFLFVHFGFSWPLSFFRYDVLCFVPKFAWNVAAGTSAWVLVSMTYQRVTAVVAPHRVGMLCSVRRGKVIVAFIVMFSCACHLQFLFTWVYWPEYDDCQYRRKYMHFTDAFEWFDLIYASVIPFIFLGIGNAVLIWQVIQSMRLSRRMRATADQKGTAGSDKVNSMSLTLILTSAAFLVLTLPLDVYDVGLQMTYYNVTDDHTSAKINLIRIVVFALWIGAFASNFYLYMLSGRKFREEAMRYLCCRHVKKPTK